MRKFLILLSSCILCSCIAYPERGEYFKKIDTNDGQTKLHLYRPERLGGIWWPRIYINGDYFIDLPIESYATKALAPGLYKIEAVQILRENGNKCELEACRYNFELEISHEKDIFLEFGMHNARTVMMPTGVGGFYEEKEGDFSWKLMDQSDGLERIKQCKLVESYL